ncbi:MAG: hypothetical protein CMO80_02080 [Verrucomicrobiales bacterium]|nr:hypothetical protein [Verrucomicrobiales bacterium]|tara:strand:+ start:1236 stop:1556 length:321 start_codon:yes stop_codon:yes gene_type:complete
MKTSAILALLSLLLLTPVISRADDQKGKFVTHTFSVPGMKCKGCVTDLQFDLEDLKAVKSAKIVFDEKQVTVVHNAKSLSAKQLIKVIKKSGFEAKLLPKKAKQKN